MIQIRHECDRCHGSVMLDPPTSTKPLDRPVGWVDIYGVYMCTACAEQVRWFITAGRLFEVGHCRQSGSGKSWTELGIERQTDPDRWHPVYAITPPEGKTVTVRPPSASRKAGRTR